MITAIISRIIILLFGTLYPAYASYKAVRTKNVKEYVKWMMYWIVFALFSCTETFTDIFLSWFPFYYEIKVILVLWLLSPATKGSSTLYRKFVHPMLTRREQEIDEYISQAKEKGYSAVLQYGSKGVNYATSVIMQTALKGGGNLVSSLKKSYSLSDLSEPDVHRSQDEVDNLTRSQRVLRPRTHSTRSSSSGRNVDMHFSEVDVIDSRPRGAKDDYRSTEDISSGYSSAEPLPGGLSRTASMTNASKIRLRSKKSEDLDSLEFESLISDPLSMHSKILLSRYPMLNEQLQLRHYDDGGEGSEYGRNIKNVSLDSNIQRQDNKPITLDEIDSAKFAMFCKWLNESNFESTPPDAKGVASTQSIDKESSDDEFVDSTSETVPPSSDKQFKETLPSVIEQANMSSVVHEISQMNEDRPTKITENTVHVINPVEQCESVPKIESVNKEHIYETLVKLPSQTNLLELPNPSLLSLNLSCGSSASDLTSENGFPRRRHNKGRAPPIPSTAAHLIADKTVDTEPIADKTVETQPIADKAVEGTPQEKEKKKKNLLTYIPSIFKPVTPSNSSKNLTKETEI
ncbi:uncharacterized protein LOC119070671 isoform X2 [Bradysia coprophila]|uniref:uncharacterized protein LOC119070671 isoform X2 n=1 Tax=Bradysia coprophila TaxID=38358 RepID=UPI00187DB2F3|nr:uncharacterized protein LOC119070671 isoform X2 [Bradysia coprophila]